MKYKLLLLLVLLFPITSASEHTSDSHSLVERLLHEGTKHPRSWNTVVVRRLLVDAAMRITQLEGRVDAYSRGN